MKKIVLIAFVLIGASVNAQIPSYVPSNGLVGWWPFNGNANDESGNGNHGTVNGAILSSDRNGSSNSAYNFNGAESILIPHNLIFNMDSNLTISLWFSVNDFNNVRTLINKNSNGNGNLDYFNLGILPSNGLIYSQFGDGNVVDNIIVPNSPNLNLWYNLTLTISDSVKLFVNGLNVGAHPRTIMPLENNENISLGYWQGQSHTFHYGNLDDIGIWNRALTEQEILALYQGCQMLITTQPTNQSVNLSGGNASFNVTTNATNPTYQWQTNLGVGFQNLSNAGQYSGVNTANLSVSNLTLTNDNQAFRCIISEAGCVDTSDIATLSIINDASISTHKETSIVLSPNPITNSFSISGIEQIVSLTLKDLNGKWIKSFDVQDENYSMSNVSSGVYFLEVSDEKRSYIIKVVKE